MRAAAGTAHEQVRTVSSYGGSCLLEKLKSRELYLQLKAESVVVSSKKGRKEHNSGGNGEGLSLQEPCK